MPFTGPCQLAWLRCPAGRTLGLGRVTVGTRVVIIIFFSPYSQAEIGFTHQVQHAWWLMSSSGCPGVAGSGRPLFLPSTQQHPAPIFAIFPVFNTAQGCVATAEDSVGSQPRVIAMILMASFKIAEKPAQTEINYPVRFRGP